MTLKEKIPYHQIHWLKLLTDISVSIVTTFLLWHHEVFWFLIFCLAPSVIVSLLIIKFVNLAKLKESSLGKYIEKHMTALIEAIRMAGQIIVWIASWYHMPFLIIIGILIVIAGWCNGQLFKRQSVQTGTTHFLGLLMFIETSAALKLISQYFKS